MSRDAIAFGNEAPSATASRPGDTLDALRYQHEFVDRHIGPDAAEVAEMLAALGVESLAALMERAVPAAIWQETAPALGEPVAEVHALDRLRALARDNEPGRSFIGMGYHDTITPAVIQRNVLENPGWYTAYTPYQPEISQGRLECLLHFQQLTMDLTGMTLANASLLDEATAAAEAMAMAKRVSRNRDANAFYVDPKCLPQTVAVLRTRAERFGFELVSGAVERLPDSGLFGGLFQYPALDGEVRDLSEPIAALHGQGAIAVVAADPMALVALKPPGEMGADVVVGSSQRFGVPMAYGGPHAAFFATRDEFKRAVPGRIIGVSVDRRGRRALRMALQTREQHIRREKANSNICTAQVLLANIAALYAMYHGPVGLGRIAARIHRLAAILATGLDEAGAAAGISLRSRHFFDTVSLNVPAEHLAGIRERAAVAAVNLRLDMPGGAGEGGREGGLAGGTGQDSHQEIGLALDECTTPDDIGLLWQILLGERGAGLSVAALDERVAAGQGTAFIPAALRRRSPILQHPDFSRYRSETEMLRYLKELENRDLSLTHAMIPLGSCTMKLNAASEMLPISWPEFAKPHPFTPPDKMPGYRQMIAELEGMLQEITGFDAVSMQPNSGAQGEYAGLLAIRNYLSDQGQAARDVCLIPTSAHGTNPASARMIGMRVVLVACDGDGNIDLADLRAKAAEHGDKLAALMITYPSTHGVYEEAICDICAVVHERGGQVYMDGANLNALVGLSKPAELGADVSHLNLHKTFCIPHGGGGPGMGPIGVRKHLAPYLPNHPVVPLAGPAKGTGTVSAAPWGSAGILSISWMYIKMMGGSGLRRATEVAVLNANYIAARLAEHYPVLYVGQNGMVAHECIIDLRPLRQATGITDEDVAKRLMDYGFHAPTMSFPVAGTLMIEPTESESKREQDRFIAAMIAIRGEIAAIATGAMDARDNPLKNAPHTLADMVDDNWNRPYSKQVAAFPLGEVTAAKYWPSVNRVDNAAGDRNLVCSCPPVGDYAA